MPGLFFRFIIIVTVRHKRRQRGQQQKQYQQNDSCQQEKGLITADFPAAELPDRGKDRGSEQEGSADSADGSADAAVSLYICHCHSFVAGACQSQKFCGVVAAEKTSGKAGLSDGKIWCKAVWRSGFGRGICGGKCKTL